jgi:hypothetical protein
MRRTSRPSRVTDGRARSAAAGLWLALPLLLAAGACQRQDGIVGIDLLTATPDAGAPDAADAGADAAPQTPTFFTDFDSNGGDWQSENQVPGSTTTFGVPITGAADPSTAELRFPGHPEFSANSSVGPNGYLTQIANAQRFSFGTYRTRVQFGACATSEEVVNAATGFFNDGTDADKNGITDDLEIDFQVLCGTPHYLYLTVFTDDDATQFRKLAHVIDFATGDVYDTPSAQKSDFTKTGTDATLVHPDLFAAGAFYEVGFEWHSASLRFFMTLDGAEKTLWTISDATHIPQRPVTYLYNLWHPDTHWFPSTSAADFPANDVVMHVDWFEYFAE